ncbi:uncharacterized protein M421DRAFT_6588 [Didymella exigua CBS 183.55]|uniref:Uncharacterized protein n=1 Tax=Didymella exigua CBS 183.55 TaxID=1150837 RepID=A0A6A5RH07_9PLEO|nr:uncharacterized protein M421DRAFT_6588 [Didymella exigua CBS 183.55]KAF1927032.1 hypothetical protein M421DRAFT_6588 [Didymella exigua CBS 183.55]
MSTYSLHAGKNLNEELLGKYKGYVLKWKKATLPKAQELMPSDTLEKLAHRITLPQDNLSTQLEASVVENYKHFTIEDDIKCPIAREMRSAYDCINDLRMHERPKQRRGIYKLQCKELIAVITKQNDKKPALPDSIAKQIRARQYEQFRAGLAELLENDVVMSAEHIGVRADLARKLRRFSATLAVLNAQCPGAETRRAAKKARTVKIKMEVDLLPGT